MSFFKKSIDGILAEFTNLVEHLHIVAEAHLEESKIHDAIAIERAKLAALGRSEYTRAKAIAAKFTALVTP